MREIAASQLPVAGAPARHASGGIPRAFRARLARAAADAWLNLLFWTARRHSWFAIKTKPLFVWGAWKYSPYIRETTLANARHLLGEQSTTAEREELAKSVVANFYDFVCDVGRSIGASREQLLERIACVERHDRYAATRALGRGAIVLTAHMGSFEVGMAALLQHDPRLHVLFRRDAFGLFERTRSTLRRRLGVIEACVDQGLSVWMKLKEALAANEVVLIQGDRVMPGQKGQPVRFLDGDMMLPTGPVKLAIASGAPILPVFTIRNPDGRIRIVVEEPILLGGADEADAGMQKITSVLEKYIGQYPEQWLMICKAWCEEMQPA